jgi:hypothetical protein
VCLVPIVLYIFVNGVLLCFVNPYSRKDRYEESGSHQMKCVDYSLKCAEPRGWTFYTNIKNICRDFSFNFVDQFTAWRFTATGAPLAPRHIRILLMNQHAWWPITFVMKGNN